MGALELQKKYGWDMVTITSEINSMSMNTPATDSIDILIKLVGATVYRCYDVYSSGFSSTTTRHSVLSGENLYCKNQEKYVKIMQ